jgi:hypothetical protein
MKGNAYVPANAPAIGDLMTLFDFHGAQADDQGMKH